ncbi:unnamed protein product [Pneumocystis jirovecii]|uniref:Arginyl-tRNA--protein transferase 1 n=1 Tax=Pneumocystis jirovecii TaxID=42068 RepID=L0PCJ8_PNEJI|nr:unnamed protein product [Pneumocystis jirovecii]
MNRGWRRSGRYIYKPNGKRSCCVLYTIRLNAQEFRPSKNHRKVLRRFHQYIWGKDIKDSQSWNLYDTIHTMETDEIVKKNCEVNNQFIPFHTFKVTFESAAYTDEKYALYVSYQTSVHKETLNNLKKENFIRFLCDTPLTYEPETGYGSFHQCYRLDGKLVAMGVIDVLPSGISSVYFMYESSLQHLCLGKISVCQEVCMTQERKSQFYYMGYYIYNNQKMKYKGEYRPSELLDPETYIWIPIEKYIEHWKASGSLYVSFCSPKTVLDTCSFIASTSSSHADVKNQETSETYKQSYSNSLFDYDMPGTLKEKDIQHFDFGKIYVLENKTIIPATQSTYYQSKKHVRRIVTESVSALGTELAEKLCLIIDV